MFIALIGTMGKDIGRFYKHNRHKSSSPTLKKPVLSSSANHTSCITISNPTITSHTRQHKGSSSNQDKVNISNIDYIHSCVTPKKHNISVQATPLITNLPLYLLSYQKQHNYPHLVKNICVSKLTTNLLMLLNV